MKLKAFIEENKVCPGDLFAINICSNEGVVARHPAIYEGVTSAKDGSDVNLYWFNTSFGNVSCWDEAHEAQQYLTLVQRISETLG